MGSPIREVSCAKAIIVITSPKTLNGFARHVGSITNMTLDICRFARIPYMRYSTLSTVFDGWVLLASIGVSVLRGLKHG
jgi:hypothetical protein